MKSRKILLVLILTSTLSISENNMQNNTQSHQNPEGSSLYEIKKYTISSGGGVISAGNFSVTSSIGQIDAGHVATAGVYKFKGGILTENTDLIFKNGFE